MKISLGMELNFTLERIDIAAREFIHEVGERKVILFNGEMGAGKTTFINAVCRSMGVKSNISSPTFSIINEYLIPGKQSVYHIDLYRLKNEEEAIAAGVEDCILSGHICFIEWPGRAAGIFPDDSICCHLYSLADNERKLRINL